MQQISFLFLCNNYIMLSISNPIYISKERTFSKNSLHRRKYTTGSVVILDEFLVLQREGIVTPAKARKEH